MQSFLRLSVLLISGFLSFSSGLAVADPFCCECKDGKKHALDESNIVVAGGKCSVKCRRPTAAQKGACEVPPAPAAAPTPATAPAPAASSAGSGGASAMLFKSDDCSGDGMQTEKSEAQLAAGIQSYQVERGIVSAFEKGNFGGATTRPVVGSMCVSPGWAIGSIKVGP